MKDIARHLRYQQRKVLQEVRQRKAVEEGSLYAGQMVATKPQESLSRKFDQNHRKPRILKRAVWH